MSGNEMSLQDESVEDGTQGVSHRAEMPNVFPVQIFRSYEASSY